MMTLTGLGTPYGPYQCHGRPSTRTPDTQDMPSEEDTRTFPCPYFVRLPGSRIAGKTNCRNRWAEIHRLKEHILSRHYRPRCPRCRIQFSRDGHLEEHFQSTDPCLPNSQRPSGLLFCQGFDQEQRARILKKKPRKLTGDQYWAFMYEVLFPDIRTEDIPSPFNDEPACTVAAYDAFATTSMLSSPDIRNTLKNIIEGYEPSSSKTSLIIQAISEFHATQVRPRFLGFHPGSPPLATPSGVDRSLSDTTTSPMDSYMTASPSLTEAHLEEGKADGRSIQAYPNHRDVDRTQDWHMDLSGQWNHTNSLASPNTHSSITAPKRKALTDNMVAYTPPSAEYPASVVQFAQIPSFPNADGDANGTAFSNHTRNNQHHHHHNLPISDEDSSLLLSVPANGQHWGGTWEGYGGQYSFEG